MKPRLIEAKKPFRLGFGLGPNADGVCAKGDLFYALGCVEQGKAKDAVVNGPFSMTDDVEALCVTETQRQGWAIIRTLYAEDKGKYWRWKK